MVDIDKKKFYHNLLLTQTYCEARLNDVHLSPAEVLRSCNPVIDGQHLFAYEKLSYDNTITAVKWNVDPLIKDCLYQHIFEIQMHNKENTCSVTEKQVVKGKILIAELDSTVIDGASELESKGFIDSNDAPPLDTWFYLIKYGRVGKLMFAWIPDKFVELTTNAIMVNCIDCFNWMDDLIPNSFTFNFK